MGPYTSSLVDYLTLRLLRFVALGGLQPPDPFRPPGECDLSPLGDIAAPGAEAVAVEALPPWHGWPAEQFRFPSPLEGPDPECAAVAGQLFPAHPGAPWVLVVPGYSTGALPPHDFGLFRDLQARALLEQGLNVALMEPPLHMSRRRRGYLSGVGLFGPDLWRMQLALRQGAGDVVATVRWLCRRSGRPVGLWGTSMGGCIAGLAATALAELAALVLLEPLDNPGDAMLAVPGAVEQLRDLLDATALDPAGLAQALRGVAPSSYPPALPPDRLLFVSPRYDRIVPFPAQEAFWQAWGRPERWVVDAGHVTAGIDPALARRAARWLAGKLGSDSCQEPTKGV